LEQFGAALVGAQRLFERQLSRLHRSDDTLDLGKRGFEGLGFWDLALVTDE